MKAAIFLGKGLLEVRELLIPEPDEDEVRIKVLACGICGTDVHIYEGNDGASSCSPPAILGHEYAGVIDKIGGNVTGYEIGDLVCVDPNFPCGECSFCRNGVSHFCENMIGYGNKRPGGFAQYSCVNKKQIYKASVSPNVAAMTEPISCCLHGIDLSNIKTGDVVAIIGGGFIGSLMIQLSKLAGASKIVLIEPVVEKRDIGLQLGADICIDPANSDVSAELRNLGILQINVVIECVGRVSTMQQAIEIAGNCATVLLFGLSGRDDTMCVNPYNLFKKEATIKASYINPVTFDRSLALLNNGKIDTQTMIAGEVGLSDLKTILATPEMREKGKWLLNPWI